ncbi:MAG: hypothetical protein AB8B67_04845 [Rickettsiaceae bacterium]
MFINNRNRAILLIILSIISIAIVVFVVYKRFFYDHEVEIIYHTSDKIKIKLSEENAVHNDVVNQLINNNEQYNVVIAKDSELPMNLFKYIQAKEWYSDGLNLKDDLSFNVRFIAEKQDQDMTLYNSYDLDLNYYQIQLAVSPTETQALSIWNDLQTRYTKLFDSKHMILQKIMDPNTEKYIFVLLVGNYKNIYEAQFICKKLSYYQQTCLIRKMQ